jgi:hypothetical protein
MPIQLNPLRSVIQLALAVMLLAAEPLFLKRQSALYQGHTTTFHRSMNATRFSMVCLS